MATSNRHLTEGTGASEAPVQRSIPPIPPSGTIGAGHRPIGWSLTSVLVERGEGDPLLGRAGAVGHLHLQLVPGSLEQIVQDVALGERGALRRGPRGRVHRAVLQDEGRDWAAAVVPANQVEPDPGGVDAGEELVFFGKLGFW